MEGVWNIWWTERMDGRVERNVEKMEQEELSDGWENEESGTGE